MTASTGPTTLRGAGLRIAADRWAPPAGVLGRGPLLMLHGGGQTRHSWRTTGADLALRGWLAHSLDGRGHGESDWAADGDYSADAFLSDLLAVIDGLDAPPVLVGASLGGMSSLLAAGEHAAARALVLVDVTPRLEPEGVAKITEFMTSAPHGFASLNEAAEAVHAYNPSRPRPPSTEGLKKNLRHRDGRWYWHWDPAFLTGGDEPSRQRRGSPAAYERARDAARQVRVPTLLVRGGKSDIVSEEGARELHELIPHAERIDVGDAGHMVAGDDNDIFTSGLADFLDRNLP